MLLFVCIVVSIGRWSDDRAWMVCHVVWRIRFAGTAVMSGDVCCWFLFEGILVGVSVFSVVWFEFEMISAISSPL